MLIRERVPSFRNKVYRTKRGILAYGLWVPRHQNILAVLKRQDGKILIPASNIVTDAGDLFYAKLAAGEATTNVFDAHEMCSAGTPGKAADRSTFTTIASSLFQQEATYPKTNDADGDNTGAGTDVRTTLKNYAKGDFNHAAITHGIVTNYQAGSPGASEPLLTGYAFAATFAKTADDTLKVFVNHTFNGV